MSDSMDILKTKLYKQFKTVEYRLDDEGVIVRVYSMGGLNESKTDYEQLGYTKSAYVAHSTKGLVWLIGWICFAFIVTITIYSTNEMSFGGVFLAFIPAFISVLFYLHSKSEGVSLITKEGYFNFVGKEEVINKFLVSLEGKKYKNITDKVRNRLDVLEKEDVEKYLLCLRENGILSEKDYSSIRSNFEFSGKSEKKLGFIH